MNKYTLDKYIQLGKSVILIKDKTIRRIMGIYKHENKILGVVVEGIYVLLPIDEIEIIK